MFKGLLIWALQLDPKYLISVECVKKSELRPFTFPDELTVRFDFKEKARHAAGRGAQES